MKRVADKFVGSYNRKVDGEDHDLILGKGEVFVCDSAAFNLSLRLLQLKSDPDPTTEKYYPWVTPESTYGDMLRRLKEQTDIDAIMKKKVSDILNFISSCQARFGVLQCRLPEVTLERQHPSVPPLADLQVVNGIISYAAELTGKNANTFEEVEPGPGFGLERKLPREILKLVKAEIKVTNHVVKLEKYYCKLLNHLHREIAISDNFPGL